MKKSLMRFVALLLVALVAVQFVRRERTNPPVQSDLEAPDAVKTILRSSCYDCHSNETRWPWYSHLAPVSWFVAHDVQEGRGKFNFSSWGLLNERQIQNVKEEMWHEIEDGEMPPGIYLFAHADARLTPEERATLRAWLLEGEGSAENP
jgi:hypothetical protein